MISPEQYASVPVYDLLEAAARGFVGIDHRFLHALVDDPTRTTPDLLRFSLEDRPRDPVNLEEDLIAIFRYLKTPEALPFYLRAVRGYAGEIPDDLLAAFHQLGSISTEPLVKLYEELGKEQGAEIPFVLAAMRIRDDRVLAVLLDHLEYDAADGALCLGLYGDPAARPKLEALLGELDENDAGLASLRRDVDEALEQIGAQVADEPPQPFDLWADYPAEATPVFEALKERDRLSYLDGAPPAYRAEAAASFINEEFSAAARERLLRAAREDEEAEVRARAWEALSGETGVAAIRKAMFERLRDPATPETEQAGLVVALARDASNDEVRLKTLALYEKPPTRAKALQAMWVSFDRAFSSYFPKHLDDPDLETRRQAIWGCGYLNVTGSLAKLRNFFDDDDLRQDALFAYALCAPTKVTPSRIRALLDKIDREAAGLSQSEIDLVATALDQRLMMHGCDPIFHTDESDQEEEEHAHSPGCAHEHSHPKDDVPAPVAASAGAPPSADAPGRNDPCPCGSGRKYKKCCGS